MTEQPSASRGPKAVSWHLLKSQAQHEARVANILQRRGFSVYLPATTERLSRPRKPGGFVRIFGGGKIEAPAPETTYERPIFRGYLFARFDYADRSRILDLADIVMFDQQPAVISDSEIERVRDLEAQLRAPKPRRKSGEVVSVQVGRITLTGTVAGHKHGMDVITLRKAA